MTGELTIADLVERGDVRWPPVDQDEPRHRLIGQPGDLTDFWRPYLEPAPPAVPPPARRPPLVPGPVPRRHIDSDEPARLVRAYMLPEAAERLRRR